jgi:hypothetical protein
VLNLEAFIFMLNDGRIFLSTEFRCVALPCWTSIPIYLCPFRNLFLWTSARRIFIVLQPVLRLIYILFCLQISIRYHNGQILSTFSQLHIELLSLKYVALKYYNNCFCSGFNAEMWATLSSQIKFDWFLVHLTVYSFPQEGIW